MICVHLLEKILFFAKNVDVHIVAYFVSDINEQMNIFIAKKGILCTKNGT